ncbi:hypothetical protein SteCoe_317 [Stentor coeruleus]|uniref:Uncharacterized protein n=1 Tax=Stentor coeruleus TaxID=5963 RepID=A0A1R2D4F4_9CILI|nr:hypothetical protein SteCoe_317 [Stentor coeruleus]
MAEYTKLTESESKALHNMLLRDPDRNMILFAKKLLKCQEKVSLPICMELLLMDKSPEQIVKEMISFYCKNSLLQFEAYNNQTEKRKKSPEPKKSKKIKK